MSKPGAHRRKAFVRKEVPLDFNQNRVQAIRLFARLRGNGRVNRIVQRPTGIAQFFQGRDDSAEVRVERCTLVGALRRFGARPAKRLPPPRASLSFQLSSIRTYADGHALPRLPSGGMRQVLERNYATIGSVGNPEHSQIKLGKAGRNRHRGRRTQVRGSAMNPVDHPHGGGEGKSPIGMPGPKTPWGKPTLGYRTRRNKRTGKYIVRRRGSGRR